MTHARDIALWPGAAGPYLGLGLYQGAPALAFVLELIYGAICWWVYRGRRSLLAVICIGNLANAPLFFATIGGPKQDLAGHPLIIVTFILVQIVTMLALVGWLSRR